MSQNKWQFWEAKFPLGLFCVLSSTVFTMTVTIWSATKSSHWSYSWRNQRKSESREKTGCSRERRGALAWRGDKLHRVQVHEKRRDTYASINDCSPSIRWFTCKVLLRLKKGLAGGSFGTWLKTQRKQHKQVKGICTRFIRQCADSVVNDINYEVQGDSMGTRWWRLDAVCQD